MLDTIEKFMNWLTDMDWSWWPVLFLRPSKDKDIDNPILVKMTFLFGSITGVILLLGSIRIIGTITLVSLVFSLILGWVLFFGLYKFTFAYFWNRRARRFRNQQKSRNESVIN